MVHLSKIGAFDGARNSPLTGIHRSRVRHYSIKMSVVICFLSTILEFSISWESKYILSSFNIPRLSMNKWCVKWCVIEDLFVSQILRDFHLNIGVLNMLSIKIHVVNRFLNFLLTIYNLSHIYYHIIYVVYKVNIFQEFLLADMLNCLMLLILFFSGHYVYIEASSPRRPGDNARLLSPIYNPSNQPSCLKFWYNMHGRTMGTLNVYTVVGGVSSKVWNRTGNRSELHTCCLHHWNQPINETFIKLMFLNKPIRTRGPTFQIS